MTTKLFEYFFQYSCITCSCKKIIKKKQKNNTKSVMRINKEIIK